MKEKFDSIILSKLPENYKAEFDAIKKDSKDFNPKFVPIFQENFDMLYGLVEKKHPEALKKGGVIKRVKPTMVKKVKVKEPKPEKTMVHKSRGKKKPLDGEDKYVKYFLSDAAGIARSYLIEGYTAHKNKVDIIFENGKEGYINFSEKKAEPTDPINDRNTKRSLTGIMYYVTDEVNKKPIESKPEPEKEPASGDSIEDCRKVLTEAGYSTKKKLAKDGKRAMKIKEPRPERVIIKDKVDGVFTTIRKEVSGSEDKDKKYSAMQKQLNEAQTLITKLFQLLSNLAEDNSTDKVEKIISLLKKIVP